MRLFQRFTWATVVVALATCVATAGSAASVSQAFPFSDGVCNSGDLCVYRDATTSSPLADTPNYVADYRNYAYWNTSLWTHDSASLALVRWTTRSVTLYGDVNFGHSVDSLFHCVPVASGGATTWVLLYSGFNDQLDSHQNTTNTSIC